MSSLETHSNSALFKRAEQLRRWEESDTNREPVSPKHKLRKIKFSSGCVFLAACAAAEKDEVIRLLEQGADIDTANVDGLTALHQACIDDNLDMVEFLVERGADVNRGDNEGWTPLHATASCGFLSIAKYLLEHGANVGAVNCDGELAVDIAETEQMEELLQGEIDEQGIDCDLARNDEKRVMIRDALDWFKSKSASVNDSCPKTGATPLHVACAKGYVDVIKVLLQCVDVDIDKQDIDGWTPLHAAAHWGQREASQLLAEHLADMESKNYVGQTAFDVADSDMYNHLEELSKGQNQEAVMMRRRRKQGLPIKRQDSMQSSEEMESAKTPSKVQRLEKHANEEQQPSDGVIMNNAEVIEKKNRVNAQTNQNTNEISLLKTTPAVDIPLEKTKPPAVVQSSNPADAKKSEDLTIINIKNRERDINEKDESEKDVKEGVGLKPSKSFNTKDKDVNEVKLRKNYSFQNDPLFCERYREVRARIQATSSLPNSMYSTQLRAPSSNYIIPPAPSVATPNATDERLSPLRRHSNPTGREEQSQRSDGLTINISAVTSAQSAGARQSSAVSPTQLSATSPATSPLPSNPSMKIRSFVPPVRDEESETQRKAKAKKVRETRRSTQGVTLEEIKSAEQLVNKNNQMNNNNNENLPISSSNDICVTATITQITTAAPTVTNSALSSDRRGSAVSLGNDLADLTQNIAMQERRPSWRLRLDNGSKFELEDAATSPTETTTPTVDPSPTLSNSLPTTTTNSTTFVRRTQPTTLRTNENNVASRPNCAPPDNAVTSAAAATAEASVTLSLRRVPPSSSSSLTAGKTTTTADDKEQDKENDVRNAHQASIPTQAAIQRRKRSKRRSTGGVFQFEGLEQELEAEKDNSGGGDFVVSDDITKLSLQSETHFDSNMSSYRSISTSKQPIAPTRRRHPSSGVRTNGSGGGTYNRSQRYTGAATSPYTNLTAGSSSAYSGSSYSSPYYPNTFRSSSSASATSSGRPSSYSASLSIPAKSLVPNSSAFSRKYDAGRYSALTSSTAAPDRRSRDLSRSGSYRSSAGDSGVRPSHSRSRSAGPPGSNAMGARSTSLTSLNSEGYVSGADRSIGSRSSSRNDLTTLTARCENGDIDYKRLYEQAVTENDRLKDKLRKSDEELRDTKQTLERLNTVTSKNSLSELEKRERRAMERKLSEMEEELKQLQKLKAENERLRAENRALTRVVSKLSNSVTK